MRYFICIVSVIISFTNVSAQSYYTELANYKVTINYPDHTLTVFVKPTKYDVIPLPGKLYYWYSANDIKITQGGFSGKLLNGTYSDFYKNKNLKEQGIFKKGLKYGKWYSWQDNGKLREIITWHRGKMSGTFSRYDIQGNLKEKGRYKDGLLSGKLIIYTGKDSSQASYYKAGKPFVKKALISRFLKNLFKEKSKKE